MAQGEREKVEDTESILSDDETVYEASGLYDQRKTSTELRREDQELLEEEDEREKLLGHDSSSGLGRIFRGDSDHNAPRQRELRRGRGSQSRGESTELMYNMEEGGRSSGESSRSRESFEGDQERIRSIIKDSRQKRKYQHIQRICIHGAILILVAGLLRLAISASSSSRPAPKKPPVLLSNGTSEFAPTTILISLDGFRADFLQRGITPSMRSLIDEGVSPNYMLPSFPSVTFPNHYTIVTGLYPESHGVVGNSFWDPELKEDFYYTNKEVSMQSKWWGGDPLWSTAEAQGIRTAVHMWPGSEAMIGEFQPAHLDKYNGTEKLDFKVNRILGLLDLPGPENPSAAAIQPRPQLIAAYVPDVDQDGHRYGPNSSEVHRSITRVDAMLGKLVSGLAERNLTEIVNLVIVSDHGMASTDTTRVLQLEDLIDTSLIEHIEGWPHFGLRPKNPNDLQKLYNDLKRNTENNPNVEVYLRDWDMPTRYHFSNNDRIAPLWIFPKTGWAIATKEEFDVQESLKNGYSYYPKGIHGYDHEHPLMRAIFLAKGPAFPHQPGSKLEPFQNIELYNILCDSIGAEPKPNNGTLRLPLKPMGLHSEDDFSAEAPADPPAHSLTSSTVSSATSSVATSAATSSTATSSALSSAKASASSTPASSAAVEPTAPTASEPEEAEPQPSEGGVNDGEKDGEGKGEQKGKDWWEWFSDKVNAAKGWALDTAHKAGDKISEVGGKISEATDKEKAKSSD
ncbi:uncharacterized protein K452DRAFT_294058 [Aplosporella prunicola CBS 121167]|uniref:Uncharacterized protein n=1 Tax=Aplosporella prunicola CBS 121167 TaxID=1176127 RepID=A0A6A6BT94_9PEZI|nr:uncharacterized protein K452DRAFT_294058 [Aplosporella prunicola CBS 121167]KAF2146485.1 hypothetical protein K452DRAFT_294058 [Aplosporella prunicola CBS 121167]